MDPDRPVRCYADADGQRWRVQCDDTSRVCLYAPDAELDAHGAQARPLERARPCPLESDGFDAMAWQRTGIQMVPAIADAPHGWQRDTSGRVFQVSFDLRRRVYIGGSYAPLYSGGDATTSRTGIDFGLLSFEHYGGPKSPTRHRVRLAEGQALLAPFAGEIVLAHYDVSRRFTNPLVRITTFVGKPRRRDLHMDIGFWAEGGHLELHDTAAGIRGLWRLVTAHATLDLWQSRDLDSYARVRGGVGIEQGAANEDNGYIAITPGGAVEGSFLVDGRGFHNLAWELAYEVPMAVESGLPYRRMHARVQYEAIFMAINDQPLSLRLAAGADRRDDIPGVPDDWAFRADAGLRFSLWAPARQP